VTFHIEGLDEFEAKLEHIKDRLDEVSGENSVSFEDLFSSSFMEENTSFTSFEELLTSGGYVVESQEDFEAIPEEQFDEHISAHTNFTSWEEMLSEASSEYISNKLDL